MSAVGDKIINVEYSPFHADVEFQKGIIVRENHMIEVVMIHPMNSSVIQSYLSRRKNVQMRENNFRFDEDSTRIRNYREGDSRYKKFKNLLKNVGLVK